MYKVEWLDDDAEIRTKRGFKTPGEAHKWIAEHNFDIEMEQPLVFYDGE